jgi:hypothetical protein
MDPSGLGLIVALAGLVAASAGRLLAHRMNVLIGREREEFESRFGDPEPSFLDEAELESLFAELGKVREELRETGGAEGDGESQLASQLRRLEARLTSLERERESGAPETSIEREYHALGLAQSKVSFNLGYAFGALGALIVLAGAVKALFFAGAGHASTGALIAVAGAIPEALAGLLFLTAGQAGNRMLENFDRGRVDRNLAAAQTIAAEIEDRELGNRLAAVLALSLARSEVSEGSLALVGVMGRTRTDGEGGA